ncbi:MAG: hypothetical protein Q8O78_11280 [Candidatus Deferrimicrobium sp.]|nr:hypothetical protein [Candidatus Deferrimicrobium sp.]
MKVPTDHAILNDIYNHYYKAFAGFSAEASERGSAERGSKIYVPVDIRGISKRLRVDPDIVFGRLYYHMEEKYGYQRPGGEHVHFFAFSVGPDKHCVNFPLLGSVLAGLREEWKKAYWAIGIAFLSLIVSAASAIFR